MWIDLKKKLKKLQPLQLFLLVGLFLFISVFITISPFSSSLTSQRNTNKISNSSAHRNSIANTCHTPSHYLALIKSAESRSELVKNTLKQGFYSYLITGWILPGEASNDFEITSHIDVVVILEAMNTFWIMRMYSDFYKAFEFVQVHLNYTSILTPAPRELFPGLVTAYKLTKNLFFYNKSLEIANNFNTMDQWPLEHLVLVPSVLQSNYFNKIELYFETRSDEEHWNGESNQWKYFWLLVNLYRYSNSTYDALITKLNYWLRFSGKKEFGNFVNSSKQYSSKRLPARLYISFKEGEMNSANCAWGAIFSLASMVDTELIGRQSSQPKLFWSREKLLKSGLNITETCRLAANSSPYKLPLSKFKFAENDGSRAGITSTGSYNLQAHLPMSYFFNYRITRNDSYQDFAWQHFTAMEDYCHLNFGAYAPVEFQHENEAFTDYVRVSSKERALAFFGPTLRYLYLTFESFDEYPLSKFVFTENGNPLLIN